MYTNTHRWYIAIYQQEQRRLQAASLYEAKKQALELFKVPKKKEGFLSVMLADVKHDTGGI
jgi:hypothetical protein